MKIITETIMAAVPVTVITPIGDIDASNYVELIDIAQKAYNAGACDILLNLGDTAYMSSSGLVALHSISLLLRGEKPLDPEQGWEVFHRMENDMDSGVQAHMKLLNPQPRVVKTLERSGLQRYFAVYTDLQEALSSFTAPVKD